MKHLILAVTLIISSTVFSQELTYQEVSSSETKLKGKFVSYTAKDGAVYKVGEKIQIGLPSTDRNFMFIQSIDISGTVRQASPNNTNTNVEIVKIRTGGSKRGGFKAMLTTKAASGVERFYIYIEDAVLGGEVISSSTVLTSDQALEELKKAKDKLDLGLITQEEFEKIKSELAPLIK